VVRRLLRYPPLPDSTTSPVTLSEDSTGNAGSDATRRITLSLSSLRRFVEDPMQGWAKAVLRVEEDRGEAPEAQEDEPFEPSRLDLTVALREAFLDAIRAGKDLETSYRELAERLQAHGQWPLGLLADLRAEADRDCLESWRAGYERIAAQAGPKRLRFGPGLEHGDADVLLSSIELELPQDPRPGAEAGSVTLEITGQTQPLLEAPAGTLLLVTKVSGNSASERRVSRRRHLLRAFFDHLALAASEQRTGPRDAFILDGAAGERSHPHPSFLAIDPSEARAYLASLARDMLGSAHAYQLPSETIFSLGDDWPALTPAALAKALANLRSPGGEGVGAARFGPVRNAGSFPVPAADEAYEMARRRFDLFFASLREPAE
jgi:exodeoxyribonuclease V gamma subunit